MAVFRVVGACVAILAIILTPTIWLVQNHVFDQKDFRLKPYFGFNINITTNSSSMIQIGVPPFSTGYNDCSSDQVHQCLSPIPGFRVIGSPDPSPQLVLKNFKCHKPIKETRKEMATLPMCTKYAWNNCIYKKNTTGIFSYGRTLKGNKTICECCNEIEIMTDFNDQSVTWSTYSLIARTPRCPNTFDLAKEHPWLSHFFWFVIPLFCIQVIIFCYHDLLIIKWKRKPTIRFMYLTFILSVCMQIVFAMFVVSSAITFFPRHHNDAFTKPMIGSAQCQCNCIYNELTSRLVYIGIFVGLITQFKMRTMTRSARNSILFFDHFWTVSFMIPTELALLINPGNPTSVKNSFKNTLIINPDPRDSRLERASQESASNRRNTMIKNRDRMRLKMKHGSTFSINDGGSQIVQNTDDEAYSPMMIVEENLEPAGLSSQESTPKVYMRVQEKAVDQHFDPCGVTIDVNSDRPNWVTYLYHYSRLIIIASYAGVYWYILGIYILTFPKLINDLSATLSISGFIFINIVLLIKEACKPKEKRAELKICKFENRPGAGPWASIFWIFFGVFALAMFFYFSNKFDFSEFHHINYDLDFFYKLVKDTSVFVYFYICIAIVVLYAFTTIYKLLVFILEKTANINAKWISNHPDFHVLSTIDFMLLDLFGEVKRGPKLLLTLLSVLCAFATLFSSIETFWPSCANEDYEKYIWIVMGCSTYPIFPIVIMWFLFKRWYWRKNYRTFSCKGSLGFRLLDDQGRVEVLNEESDLLAKGIEKGWKISSLQQGKERVPFSREKLSDLQKTKQSFKITFETPWPNEYYGEYLENMWTEKPSDIENSVSGRSRAKTRHRRDSNAPALVALFTEQPWIFGGSQPKKHTWAMVNPDHCSLVEEIDE